MTVSSNQHAPSEAEVAVIGAGVAGLSAALTLGRACRRVVLYDHGPPRNAAVAHAHGLLTRDGASPTELRRIGLEELAAYDVDVRRAEVVSVERAGGETSVPGVYAVGDMTTLSQQISFGIAAGAAAAVHLNHALIAGVPAESTV